MTEKPKPAQPPKEPIVPKCAKCQQPLTRCSCKYNELKK